MNCFTGWKDLAPDAHTFEDQVLRGPAANEGYDPVGAGDRQPYEARIIMRPGQKPKQYVRRGAYWSPSEPPVEFSYQTLVNPVTLDGRVEEVIRAPLTWSHHHHGVGHAGSLYWLRSGGLYAHHVSYGLDSPIYPPGFIQCAIQSTRMKPLVFVPRLHGYFTRGELLFYVTAPVEGGLGFLAVSHPDGVNEFSEVVVTRSPDGYRVRYQSLEIAVPDQWVITEVTDPRRRTVAASGLAFFLALLLWLAPVTLLVTLLAVVAFEINK